MSRVFASLDELCARDVDAIAVFSPPWLHAQHSLQALPAGKHVFCAVLAALTIEDLRELTDTVRRTGRTYWRPTLAGIMQMKSIF